MPAKASPMRGFLGRMCRVEKRKRQRGADSNAAGPLPPMNPLTAGGTRTLRRRTLDEASAQGSGDTEKHAWTRL